MVVVIVHVGAVIACEGWQRDGGGGLVVCVIGMGSSVVVVMLCGCVGVVVGCDGL